MSDRRTAWPCVRSPTDPTSSNRFPLAKPWELVPLTHLHDIRGSVLASGEVEEVEFTVADGTNLHGCLSRTARVARRGACRGGDGA